MSQVIFKQVTQNQDHDNFTSILQTSYSILIIILQVLFNQVTQCQGHNNFIINLQTSNKLQDARSQ